MPSNQSVQYRILLYDTMYDKFLKTTIYIYANKYQTIFKSTKLKQKLKYTF